MGINVTTERVKRRSLAAFVAMLGMTGAAPVAGQQVWKPEKAVEIIVPSGPGGGTDMLGRLIQRIWQDRRLLEVPVTVVNKPGGGGSVSLAYLKQHTGDAHYLQAVSAVLLTNHIVGRSKFSYAEFTPLALLNSEYVVIAVKSDSPLQNLKDLMARLKQDTGAVSIAVGTSLGGVNHISAAAIARAAGGDPKKLKTVVFKSSAESAVATLGGHVDIMASSASLVLPHLRSGAMRILGVSAPKRQSGDLATALTLKEQGVDAVVDNFRLIIGTSGMIPAQIAFWDQVLARLSQDEEWRKDLESSLWENSYMNSSDTRKYLDAQYSQLKGVLTDVGLVK
jgi:putative tricarboxylic transport membrane protein